MYVPIRLHWTDAERYARLRLRMLEDSPWAFSASREDDFALDLDRLRSSLREEQNAIFAIEAPAQGAARIDDDRPELVASAGVYRKPNLKAAHRAGIWGVYVDPLHRGKGLGRLVLAAAIDAARTWTGVDFIDLSVSEKSPGAQRLYESLGFRAWGREPEALDIGGRRYDEIHMALRLKP